MSDASDDDIDNVPDSQLVNMPASNFGAGNAGRIQNRIDRLFEQSLSEDNISAYALPLFMNFKLRRQKELEARAEALEEEEFEERHRTPLGEREEIRRFMETMDRHIQNQQSALDSIKANQQKLAQLREELDARTLVVDGRKVYRDGDHFVDENGERLNEKDEAEAQKLFKLHPEAATFERLQQLRDAENQAETAAQTVGDNIKADNTAKTGATTPDQRRSAETRAGEHEVQAGDAAKTVGESTGAVANAMKGDVLALPKVNAGKGAPPAPPGKSDQVAMQVDPALPGAGGTKAFIDRVLFPKPTAVEHGNELGQSNGRGAVVADALPPKGNASVDTDKGNPKQTNGSIVSEQAVASNHATTWAEAKTLMGQKVSLTSYASTLSPTPGKGDLTSSFDAALTNVDQLQTASADTDVKVDKSPLSTEFAAVVTPSEDTPDQAKDDKVTPTTPAAQRQTVAV